MNHGNVLVLICEVEHGQSSLCCLISATCFFLYEDNKNQYVLFHNEFEKKNKKYNKLIIRFFINKYASNASSNDIPMQLFGLTDHEIVRLGGLVDKVILK
ncbi:hypothetical protein BpHYR1_028297 [Brachionus plicatilis]|uniref:Uncharacterized protein n=1 Tax=Brachionus plicatilis TaxID=10195 RepID=A0A3M7RZN9_BRAPC|nr:hypothetical protein BpHYR1_028297 [Brachionus plicatilis]